MEEIKWQVLDEVAGNVTAELIRSYLEAYEIPVLLSQEGAGHFAFPVNIGVFGRVQILVPDDKIEQAKQLLDEYRSGSSEESPDQAQDLADEKHLADQEHLAEEENND